MRFKSFNIYFAKVKDYNGFAKTRPVVALTQRTNGNLLCLKVTSQFKNKSKYIRHNYCILRNWKLEGLHKPSYVDMNRYAVIEIPKQSLIHKFGYLSYHDLHKVIDFGLSRY